MHVHFVVAVHFDTETFLLLHASKPVAILRKKDIMAT